MLERETARVQREPMEVVGRAVVPVDDARAVRHVADERVAQVPLAERSASRLLTLDGRSGALLWKVPLGGQVNSGPMSYSVNGRQYITVAAGTSLFAFALRQ